MTFEKAKVMNLKDEIDYSTGGVVSKQVSKNKGGNITLFSFDEGQSLSEHTAPFDAMLEVVEGKAEIMIDGQLYPMEAGEFIILPANVPHAVKAITAFKMLLTMLREN